MKATLANVNIGDTYPNPNCCRGDYLCEACSDLVVRNIARESNASKPEVYFVDAGGRITDMKHAEYVDIIEGKRRNRVVANHVETTANSDYDEDDDDDPVTPNWPCPDCLDGDDLDLDQDEADLSQNEAVQTSDFDAWTQVLLDD